MLCSFLLKKLLNFLLLAIRFNLSMLFVTWITSSLVFRMIFCVIWLSYIRKMLLSLRGEIYDDVAMGSSLGPRLANISVGCFNIDFAKKFRMCFLLSFRWWHVCSLWGHRSCGKYSCSSKIHAPEIENHSWSWKQQWITFSWRFGFRLKPRFTRDQPGAESVNVSIASRWEK